MATPSRTKTALTTAADDVRLQLILHAAVQGHVAPNDARRYAHLNPRSGTPQYHIGKLVAAGLLAREQRGRYVLTPAGRLIAWLDTALRHLGVTTPELLDLTITSPSSAFNDQFAEGSELFVELIRQLPNGSSNRSVARVARGAAVR